MFSLTVMMYHYVRDPGDEAEAGSGIPGLPVAQFESQVDRLAREHEMISWEDLKYHLATGRTLPPNACLLTFDDGVCDQYFNVFPALRRRGLSGLFFALAHPAPLRLALGHKLHYLLACMSPSQLREAVWARLDESQHARFARAEAKYCPEWTRAEVEVLKLVLQREMASEVEAITSELIVKFVGPEREIARKLYLSTEQIREMTRQGMHLGGHSETHPWLDFVDPARRSREIEASAEWLRQVEAAPYAFAYPYGGLAADAPALLRANGFAAGFTTREQVEQSDPFFIGRFDGERVAQSS
jgi:peptidoglycan/xylan/chitin deacetylase (PgdA/CDA1 family)